MSILAQRGTVAGVTITKIAWLQALQVPGAKVRLILPACFKVTSNLEGGKSCPVPVVCREDWFCKDYIETFTTKKKAQSVPVWARSLDFETVSWAKKEAYGCLEELGCVLFLGFFSSGCHILFHPVNPSSTGEDGQVGWSGGRPEIF